MHQTFNEPNFRVNVFCYHPGTGALVANYRLDQYCKRQQRMFNAISKACSDSIEAAQSTDGLRYVAYFPHWDSWVIEGNRVYEVTIGA